MVSCPELEKVHIIAHSRGTDVAITALKELILVARAGGAEPDESVKLGTIVLAAADLSNSVLLQRFSAEQMQDWYRTIVVYVNRNDRAILTAEWLFGNQDRIGQIRPEQFTPRQQQRMQYMNHGAIVDSRVSTNYLAAR